MNEFIPCHIVIHNTTPFRERGLTAYRFLVCSCLLSYQIARKKSRKSKNQHGNPFSDFFGKTCLNRPADSLRCLPVTAVRPVLYRNLQSNDTKFLHFVPFCFFRWWTAISCFLSIDRFQLVCFARVAACPPLHPPRQAEPA